MAGEPRSQRYRDPAWSQRYRDAAWSRPAACATLRTQEGAADEERRKIGQKDIPLE